MSTNFLSPTERIEAHLTRKSWEAYEIEREKHLEILRNPDKSAENFRGRYIESKHGTRSRYRVGCRCRSCRKANREYMDEYRRKQGVKKREARAVELSQEQRALINEKNRQRYQYYKDHPEEIPEYVHGTTHGYNYYRCRCDDCRETQNEYRQERRRRSRGVLQDGREA